VKEGALGCLRGMLPPLVGVEDGGSPDLRALAPWHLSLLRVSICPWNPFDRLLLLFPPAPLPVLLGHHRHWLQLERGPYLVSRLLHEICSFLQTKLPS
jgi:squalene cyclase